MRLIARSALLPDGWAENVALDLRDGGSLAAIHAGALPDGRELLPGIVLPAMVNLHCHAFQRAMAGLAEYRTQSQDSFWTWRKTMYRFAGKLTPEELEAIAAQAYVEMLEEGYGAVVEFHYLHHRPDGQPHGDRAAMAQAIIRAARRTGIGLTLLPSLYMAGGFGNRAPEEGQRRFLNDVHGLIEMIRVLGKGRTLDGQFRIGLALHSLRAVPPGRIREAVALMTELDPAAPIHIHAAEQRQEVEDCRQWSGLRPVEWLLEHEQIDHRWCLVHATHMEKAEVKGLAHAGAVAGLCPTTEANLGDGTFPLAAYLKEGGRIGVGSDSCVSASPFAELRQLEYAQRLAHEARTLCADEAHPHAGARLFREALEGGARAAGRTTGRLEAGRRADFICIDPDHPRIAGRRHDTLLDSLVFSGERAPVTDVMVGGKWRVRNGRHVEADAIAEDYRRVVAKLG